MDQSKYEANKQALKANNDLFLGILKTSKEKNDFVLHGMFSMIHAAYQLGVAATRENTEYECRNSNLTKMTESLMKESKDAGNS